MPWEGLSEGTTRQSGHEVSDRSLSSQTQIFRHDYASDESSGDAVNAELLERLSLTSKDAASKSTEERNERYRMSEDNVQLSGSQRRRPERRRSSGNVSDPGDTGIFEFDDQ